MSNVTTELLHVAAGIVGTALIAAAAAWSVPNAGETIWDVAYVAMVAVAVMSIRPLRLAWRADRAARSTNEPRTDG